MDYRQNYTNTVATIKSEKLLMKCDKCNMLICGWAVINHNLFCSLKIENGEIRPTESGDKKHDTIR